MNQEVTFERPQRETKSMADLQNIGQTIKASSLLSKHEQNIVPKIGGFIVIQYEGECYTVPPHVQVPASATILRAKSGALVGFGAVTGG